MSMMWLVGSGGGGSWVSPAVVHVNSNGSREEQTAD